jgi:two-component system, NtrC family, sensor kinase
MKLSLKLTLILGAVVIGTMIFAGWLSVSASERELEAQARQRAKETGEELAAAIQVLPPDAAETAIGEMLDRAWKRHRGLIEARYLCDDCGDTGGEKVEIKATLTEDKATVKRVKGEKKPGRARPPRTTKVLMKNDAGVPTWVMVPATQPARAASSQPARLARAPSSQPTVAKVPGSQPIVAKAPGSQPARGGRKLGRLDQLDAPATPVPAVKRPASRQTRIHSRNPSGAGGARVFETTTEFDPPGPATRAQLITVTSLEASDRLVATQKQIVFWVSGLAVLFLVAITFVVSSSVVGKRLGRVADAMGVVERGDLKTRIDLAGQDEVGMLAAGFNRMVTELDRATAEITALNTGLEEKVNAATRDLFLQNQTLEHLNRLLVETRRELGDKERLAALGQLAAQLAHEVGTPLSSVSVHLQLAMADKGCPSALHDRLKVATGELTRISEIIRDYLASTRPVAPAPRATDLRRLAAEAAEMAALARRAGTRAAVAVSAEVESLRTDPTLLRQILLNVLSNAHDAAGPEGSITLTAELAGGQVVVRVADDGPGIAPEDRARIFEPFYTTKGRGRGTGLGLSISRELARALGGTIALESEVGRGSTFIVTLPFEAAPIPVADTGDSGRVATAGGRDSQRVAPREGQA